VWLIAGALTALFWSPAASAAIDVRLNVEFADPMDMNSGGMWHLIAKSDGAGILALSARLTGIQTAAPVGPTGIVNGGNDAGFGVFQDDTFGGHRNVTIGQAPLPPGTFEQSVFYGVGTLTNGSPEYAGKPVGSNSLGPTFTTLTSVLNVPWAAPVDPMSPFFDPAWTTGARLLEGTFNAGSTPAFFAGEASTGRTFTAVGTSTMFGNISPITTLNTSVRTNFIESMFHAADYNRDGAVNAADYTVWRNEFGMTGTALNADGINDDVIDRLDYDFWKMHYGETSPGSGGSLAGSPVPEPAAACLLLLAAVCMAPFRVRFRGSADGQRGDRF
jgi:hypothetical protein